VWKFPSFRYFIHQILSVGVLFVQELLTLGLPSNSPFEEEVFVGPNAYEKEV